MLEPRLRNPIFAIAVSALLLAAPQGLGSLGHAAPHPIARRLSSLEGARQKISLALADAELSHALGLLADQAGVNLVLTERVKGKVTVSLKEVRWADAMASLLHAHGLDAALEGNILYVDTAEAMAAEEALRLKRTESQLALAPLVTRIIPVSYAKAADLAPIVETLLSERGSVRVDERTNCLIVTDVAERVRQVQARTRR